MRVQLNANLGNVMTGAAAHLSLDTEKVSEQVETGAAPRRHSQNIMKFAM